MNDKDTQLLAEAYERVQKPLYDNIKWFAKGIESGEAAKMGPNLQKSMIRQMTQLRDWHLDQAKYLNPEENFTEIQSHQAKAKELEELMDAFERQIGIPRTPSHPDWEEYAD